MAEDDVPYGTNHLAAVLGAAVAEGGGGASSSSRHGGGGDSGGGGNDTSLAAENAIVDEALEGEDDDAAVAPSKQGSEAAAPPWSVDVGAAWDANQEALVRRWGDQARCYAILFAHEGQRAYKLYLAGLAPILLFSCITGANNIGISGILQSSIGCVGDVNVLQLVLGVLTLLSAILCVFSQFFHFPKHMEKCRRAETAWRELFDDIETQLTLAASHRGSCYTFMKTISERRAKVLRSMPQPSDAVVRAFAAWAAVHAVGVALPDMCAPTLEPLRVCVATDTTAVSVAVPPPEAPATLLPSGGGLRAVVASRRTTASPHTEPTRGTSGAAVATGSDMREAALCMLQHVLLHSPPPPTTTVTASRALTRKQAASLLTASTATAVDALAPRGVYPRAGGTGAPPLGVARATTIPSATPPSSLSGSDGTMAAHAAAPLS